MDAGVRQFQTRRRLAEAARVVEAPIAEIAPVARCAAVKFQDVRQAAAEKIHKLEVRVRQRRVRQGLALEWRKASTGRIERGIAEVERRHLPDTTPTIIVADDVDAGEKRSTVRGRVPRRKHFVLVEQLVAAHQDVVPRVGRWVRAHHDPFAAPARADLEPRSVVRKWIRSRQGRVFRRDAGQDGAVRGGQRLVVHELNGHEERLGALVRGIDVADAF